MVEAGVVEALIALPTQLFSTTGIGVTVWVLNRPGARHDIEVLLVDARDSGRMISQFRRDLPAEDIVQIADAVLRWRDRHTRPDYRSIPGFSRPVPIEEIRDHDYQLTPELYVGREVRADSPVESITELLNRLDRLHARAAAIDDEVTRQLNRILP